MVQVEGGDRDVVGFARDGDDACVTVLRVRGGRLLARDQRFLENSKGEEDAAVSSRRSSPGTYLAVRRAGGRAAGPVRLRGSGCCCEASLEGTAIARCRSAARAASSSTWRSRTRGTCSRSSSWPRSEAEERATNPVYELQRELGLQRVPRTSGVLRHLHGAGHRYRRLVRLVRERPSPARRVPEVQGEDRGGHRRLRVDARGGGRATSAAPRGAEAAARPGGDRRREGTAARGPARRSHALGLDGPR